MNSINTILFDWDGTLVDTAKTTFEAFRKSLGDLGIRVSFALYEKIYSPNWRNMYRALQLPVERWQEAEDLWTRYYGEESPDPVEGSLFVIRELVGRGYYLGIVTSGTSTRVLREISRLGMANAFQAVVCNEDVVHKKPHPEGLEKAMHRMNKRPEICCYVGDSADDMEMGKHANLQTIGILGNYPGSTRLMDARPDFCFESLSDLLKHF